MNKVIRIALALVLVLALGLLTACSSGGNSTATTAPTDAPTEAPAEETEAPAEETEAPAEETEAPAEETEAPAEETEAPAEETESAAEEEAAVDETVEKTDKSAATEEAASDDYVMPDFTGTTLIVFNWYDYIDPDTITMFEEESGAKVEYVNFTTNEEMYTKLEAGAANYDVIFPSDYMIERMIAADMLEELDTANMPHLSGIRDWLRNPAYDPEEKYSVPYMSGTVGILYNTTMVEGEIDSWDALFDEKYAGNVIMMNSQRDTIAVGLKKLGYSLNSREESELQEACDLLVKQKQDGIPSGYLLDETKDKMVGGEAALSVVYSGDALYAMDKNEDLAYSVPKEGSNVWVDGMCVPKGSQNKACAEAFIDFMCREDIAALNTDYIRYVPVIQSVADALEETETERTYAVIAPDDEIIARCEFFHDILDAMDIYEQVWMDIRLAK